VTRKFPLREAIIFTGIANAFNKPASFEERTIKSRAKQEEENRRIAAAEAKRKRKGERNGNT
jgi:hypothetical protein